MGWYQGERVLVTGGAGSIGGRVALDLCDAGARVVVVDNLSSGRSLNIPPQADFVLGDVADAHLMAEVYGTYRPSFVFHLAAHFAHANSIHHPVSDLSSNGLGSLITLELAAKHRVRRFIYASSSCVLLPSETPLSEDAASGSCETPYSISKLTGEQYARFFAHFHGLPVTVIRYFNSYGPGDLPGSYRSVIPNIL
jgi:nucleoside-diphosphate-sugar epimerase